MASSVRPYSEVVITYLYRSGDNVLLDASSPPSIPALAKLVRLRRLMRVQNLPGRLRRLHMPTRPKSLDSHMEIALFELEREDSQMNAGALLVYQRRAEQEQLGLQLQPYLTWILLRALVDNVPPPPSTMTRYLETEFTDLFQQTLLYDAYNYDGWNKTGRAYFIEKVAFFTRKHKPIQMALPAFPCKTSNPEKAASSMPDGAEYEALCRLQAFCHAAGQLYPSGCYINIVSDGHVFSDCTGTDDETVTQFNVNLQHMLKMVAAKQPCPGGIRFYNLEQLLFPDTAVVYKLLEPRMSSRDSVLARPSLPGSWNIGNVDVSAGVASLQINHPLHTNKIEINETCRKVLVNTFAPPMSFVEDLIKSNSDHAITALFRGFSRFMCEDLAHHPDFERRTSSKQRKRVAEAVALEMVSRNMSYSRLVETVLPKHVRLSIHAHNNTGPKFAIQLLKGLTPVDGAHQIRDIFSVSPEESLHIPTPWHNTLVDIYGDLTSEDLVSGVATREKATIICKARVVTEMLENGYEGGYCASHARGGRFIVWKAGRGLKSGDLGDSWLFGDGGLRIDQKYIRTTRLLE